MNKLLNKYAEVVGEDVIQHLRQLSRPLQGKKIIHVNSTREGGGVAEILHKLVPMMRDLDIDADWHVISGDNEFFQCTKAFHNALQGNRVAMPAGMIKSYERTSAENAETLCPVLDSADFVFIHDLQPAALLKLCGEHKGKWIWRCHVDISRPYRLVWKYLHDFISIYDASVFSLADFQKRLPHPQYIIPPSIDPLSEKNIDLPQEEIDAVCSGFQIDRARPLIVQVSRFDRFKDPLGVIHAYQIAKRSIPALQLVLAGGGATDDPEGEAVFKEVEAVGADDPDIHILMLPPDSHRIINALQRAADIVLQKSIKEGFGLTVTEAMWKGKPVIGGNVGGIRLQVVNHHTGFLVDSPEGAALRIRYLLSHREKIAEMGEKTKRFARDNFLLTRQLRDYLTMLVSLSYGNISRIELE
ncbi:MAG: glycosyltransferase [Candidatus Abyssobacteria bacterium SURF_5]|uniref:Glycosyltransferase n=1 Tax=Abyssobacteria bacterium (strain SURF_5) TaxID=2093360 RepID=A0A3A4NR27_ABYX5|nr:MAG: glycosyltransferase [Candidatus Abyssubacteria bacterium SURF_5]